MTYVPPMRCISVILGQYCWIILRSGQRTWSPIVTGALRHTVFENRLVLSGFQSLERRGASQGEISSRGRGQVIVAVDIHHKRVTAARLLERIRVRIYQCSPEEGEDYTCRHIRGKHSYSSRREERGTNEGRIFTITTVSK